MTGYFRDAETGLDYADQRYHQPGVGRFLTADPYVSSAGPTNPGTWNRYAYVGGDPVNFKDPTGRIQCLSDQGGDCGGTCDPCDQAGDCWDPLVICGGGGGSGPGGGGPPAQQPCWANLGNINETLTDLGENIEEIAATVISNASELAALTGLINNDVSQEMLQITASIVGTSQAGPDFVGGHFNLIIQASDLAGIFSNADYRQFRKAFGGHLDGTRQAAVYGNAAQGNYTLHSKQHGNNNTGYFNAHFDIYNPYTDVVSTIAHLYGDVIGGHNGSPCLDPAWQ